MRRPKIKVDHIASKWDRSPKSLKRDINRSARAGADVITVTEVADGKRHKALSHPDYETFHDRTPWQAGETAAMVRKDFGTVVHWGTQQIGPDLGPGNEVYCIILVIRIHATGQLLLVGDAHLPSAVESRWKERRGRLYRKMVRNYKQFRKEVRAIYKPDAEIIWADWNLNLNLAWVRDWIKKAWRGMRALGKRKMPRKGSHHKRLIDWPITKGIRRRKLTVLKQTAGSDHRTVRLVGRVANVRRRK